MGMLLSLHSALWWLTVYAASGKSQFVLDWMNATEGKRDDRQRPRP